MRKSMSFWSCGSSEQETKDWLISAGSRLLFLFFCCPSLINIRRKKREKWVSHLLVIFHSLELRFMHSGRLRKNSWVELISRNLPATRMRWRITTRGSMPPARVDGFTVLILRGVDDQREKYKIGEYGQGIVDAVTILILLWISILQSSAWFETD